MRTQDEINAERNKLNTLFNRVMALRDQGKGMPDDGRRVLDCKDVLDWVNGDNDTAPSEELSREFKIDE